jgi:hypothetical protein
MYNIYTDSFCIIIDFDPGITFCQALTQACCLPAEKRRVHLRHKAVPTPYLIILQRNFQVGCGDSDAIRGSEMLASEAELHEQPHAGVSSA